MASVERAARVCVVSDVRQPVPKTIYLHRTSLSVVSNARPRRLYTRVRSRSVYENERRGRELFTAILLHNNNIM